ncbi:FecR family protein [Parapedobacter sp. 10938]|uniref:FecR family protein n=1 Tax=Parapedobacter flavus TaxID=3110225 RepID=UPI002DBC6BEA|nr:FecR family protein [Parapedobacter sp. 10938]MEC3880686.1 FecR family protein [Parapedobacter sp. 10938]
MPIDKIKLRLLLKKYLNDNIGSNELQMLRQYVLHTDDPTLLEQVLDELWREQTDETDQPIPSARLYQSILHQAEIQGNLPIRNSVPMAARWRFAAAIAALLCICAGLFWFIQLVPTSRPHPGNTEQAIVPGGNKATLTLADGRTVFLSEAQSNVVVNGDDMRYGDGSMVLKHQQAPPDALPTLMTITTPRGGTYQITLSDGTKVWLNSASMLTYPQHFDVQERIVQLEGEAYFEVTSQPQEKESPPVPFLVKTSNQTVRVLGTRFNITAYPDEANTKTTLVEGSVQVTNLSSRVIKKLIPGNQSITRGRYMEVKEVDADPEIAWKDGYFAFADEHISNVMSTIARWYNIEVEYQGDMTNKYFGGTLSRFEDFETLLKTIELTGSVRFKIMGRRVIVMT